MAWLAVAVIEAAINDYRCAPARSRRHYSATQFLHGKTAAPGKYASMLEFCCMFVGSDPDYVKENALSDKNKGKRSNKNKSVERKTRDIRDREDENCSV
jgi:hypothetical protein